MIARSGVKHRLQFRQHRDLEIGPSLLLAQS